VEKCATENCGPPTYLITRLEHNFLDAWIAGWLILFHSGANLVFIYPSIHLFIDSSIISFIFFHSSDYSSIRSSSLIHPFTHLLFHLFIHPFINAFTCPIYLFVQSFFCLFTLPTSIPLFSVFTGIISYCTVLSSIF